MAAINVDQLTNEIMKRLEIYTANTVEDVAHAVEVVAKETAAELQETSPVGSTGDYAKSWSYKRNQEAGRDYNSMVVYSKKPGYRVAHLLEHGHDAVNGSFVAARPHIAAAEKKAENWLEDMLTKNLSG